MSIEAEKGILCGDITDDRFTCNEEIKRTQKFVGCDAKVLKGRFRQDVCNFCQCVLTSGSNFCHMCGAKSEGLNNAEGIHCGGAMDDGSTCNEKIKRTQNFCQACGTKVDEQRFRQDVCSFCQCVLTSGSNFCNMCGTKTEGLRIVGTSLHTGTQERAADGKKQLSLTKEKEGQCTTVTGASNITPEPIEMSEKHETDTISGPGLSADEMKRMETAAHGGISMVDEYINAKINEWKLIPIHIAVTGNSVAGKSSFINALRDVKKGQNGYAEIGVTETTTKLKGYPHPQNKSLVFWDMPGVGTPDHRRAEYLERVQFEKYDFFLIFTVGRFTENDLWLANAVRNQKKAFYFIRTRVGFDFDNARNDDPDSRESDVFAKIRNDCIVKLKKAKFEDPSVYLIDNHKTDKYDFGTLVDTLLKKLPEKKREAMALSLTFITEKVIMIKKNALRKRILFVSIASAIVGAVPIPGLGAVVDSAIIFKEADEYKRQFGLNDEALLKHSPKHVQVIRNKYAQNIAQLIATVTVDEAVENAVTFGIPLLGSILSGTVSYGVSVTVLCRLLNSMADDALRINEDMIKWLSSETDV